MRYTARKAEVEVRKDTMQLDLFEQAKARLEEIKAQGAEVEIREEENGNLLVSGICEIHIVADQAYEVMVLAETLMVILEFFATMGEEKKRYTVQGREGEDIVQLSERMRREESIAEVLEGLGLEGFATEEEVVEGEIVEDEDDPEEEDKPEEFVN